MQNNVYSKLYEKLMGEVSSFEKNSHFQNIKFITLNNSIDPKKPADFLTVKKLNKLYSSIIDAKETLLKYSQYLKINIDCEHNCITPLNNSNKYPMLFYKREDLTSIKAYKVRGALYQMSKILENTALKDLRFIAASTGNHALGVLRAAEILKVKNVTICISKCVTEFKKQELRKKIFKLNAKGINAELLVKGETFDKTNDFAKNLAESDERNFYIDPYNNHNAVAGQGTIGLEVLNQLERKLLNSKSLQYSKLKQLTVVVPIGGGGLISGISCALKIGMKKIPSLKHLKLKIVGVKLKDFNSVYGDAIKVKEVGGHNSELINYLVENKVDINDSDMEKGIDFIFNDIGVIVEGASAGTLTPIIEELVVPSETNVVVCILSGGNTVT